MEDNDKSILLRTIHGSHLYGLNNANSDLDYYTVIDYVPEPNVHGHVRKRMAFQTVDDEFDQSLSNFKTFAQYAYNGVPQALEAMFSPYATIDVIAAYRRGFRVSVQAMSGKYVHAIEKFSAFDFKRRRHTLRYALNLQEAIEKDGRFNPVLSPSDAQMITEMAISKDYIKHLRELSYFDLNLKEDKIKKQLDFERYS